MSLTDSKLLADKSVYDLEEHSIFEATQKTMLSGMRLYMEYWEVFAMASSKVIPTGYFDKVYENWLDAVDRELDTHLRSDEFINVLNEYIESCAILHDAMRRMGYPVLLINEIIDEYLQASMVLANIPVEPHETPHKVVHRKDATRLLRYSSSPEYKTPLLIVYAPINRYHIMDLNTDKSIVRHFVDGGFDTFLLDWGTPRDNSLTISDYVNYIDESIEEIKKLTNADTVTLFGYCWGGVLSIIYAALHNERLKNLIVQAAPVDFDKDDSILADWSRKFPVDTYVDEFEEMDGHILNLGFLMRNPIRYAFDKYIKFMQRMDDLQFVDNFIRVERWLYNTPDVPGEFFRQFIKDLYKKNLLIQNKLQVDKKTVDLRKITVPVLNIVGVKDDLALAASSTPLNEAVSSKDKKLVEFPVGHVGLCASRSAHKNLWPQVVKWLQERST